MTQTLTGSILAAKARATETPTQDDGSAEAKLSYHDSQRQRQMQDSSNELYKGALELAKEQTQEFLASVRNFKSPTHDADVQKFNDAGQDSKKIEQEFTDKICAKLSVPYELQDQTYENMVFEKYKPQGVNANRESAAMHDIFKQKMKEKWQKSGYRNDRACVAEITSKYGLTPRNELIKYQQFEPKA